MIENWRPISLLTVDYKIISKILANRLKFVMHKIVAEEQYCGIIGKSLVSCNNNIRDVIEYVTSTNNEAAVINLDWSKAFDRVDMQFLFKVMRKLGIPTEFIEWVEMLYHNTQSCVSINGLLGARFHVERSVRQGCPLSMLLYVIFQEPLYQRIKTNVDIVPPHLPNKICMCIQGFADDSTVFVSTDKSIIELQTEITSFEKVTGAKLNKSKTNIMGLGIWRQRRNWPLEWLETVECTKILGVYHCQSCKDTLRKNWDEIIRNINTYVNMLSNRYLSLYQKGIIINSLLLSKVWYIAHTLPIDKNQAQKINSCIFNYLWKGMYHPINRNTLCLPKDCGGLGILDVYFKATAIFCATTLKEAMLRNPLTLYYCSIRLSYLIGTVDIKDVSYVTPPYYSIAVTYIRMIIKHPNFPHINSKDIYVILKPKTKALVEGNYPLLKWEKVWKNLNNAFIDARVREVLYRYIHDTLATNKRLEWLNIKTNGNCSRCSESEFSMHIFYFCKSIEFIVTWFRVLLGKLCKCKSTQFLKILMLDVECYSKKDKNTAIMLISDYIYCLWISRQKGYNVNQTFSFLKGRINYSRWTNQCILGNNMHLYFTNSYVNLFL